MANLPMASAGALNFRCFIFPIFFTVVSTHRAFRLHNFYHTRIKLQGILSRGLERSVILWCSRRSVLRESRPEPCLSRL